jgi:sporulation protein YunB
LIDKNLNVILEQYINIEAERLTNNIVSNAVNEIIVDEDYDDFLNIVRNNNTIEQISYNTKKINKLKNDMAIYIQKKLLFLDDGKIDEFFISNKFKNSKFKNIKKGILCEVSLGSLRNSTIFANIGPTIPLKLIFLGEVNTDIDIKIKEYGINNIMIQVYLIVDVNEQVSMPITSKKKNIIVREPISIDIINGEIPDYFSGITS